ncbi:NDR1/HIN1-like protein 10 [Abrus precatorius]|uniref:NDR1/HIN1-like protein 10 n=1 Tax=Abrus precatorius TaxID=3816 RepID=A0A8B8MFS7_ABRPR|nr:NDR1/HIN1-like protein 10 [Abrus precatorius]
MAEYKQPRLNGAYYGPAIPPAEPPRQRSNSARRCCCCLLSIFCKVLVAIIVFIGLFILIFWLVVQPRLFKFHVSEAKLTQFNYTDNTLHYNLVLNFTARNPNKKLNIYYDKVEGQVLYDGVGFASTDVVTWKNSFRQHTKSTDSMSGVFLGQYVVARDHERDSDFDKDKKRGVFHIDVRLYFTIRFRLGDGIGGDTKAKAKCELGVPLSSNGITGTAFQPTECDVDF